MKTNRLEMVDALRGFAVLAIILIHNLEHFNLYHFPEYNPVLTSLDKFVWDGFFFLFAGKAYAIFSLLFGFSFAVQFHNRRALGGDFAGRFLWRLIGLACWGLLNALFFPGDVLVMYAMVGVLLVPIRNLSNRALCILAAILMLQPMEWGKVVYALIDPTFTVTNHGNQYWSMVMTSLTDGNFFDAIKANILYGEPYSLWWQWENGRFFQTASLFIIGMLLYRNHLFVYSHESKTFWLRTLRIATIWFGVFYIIRNVLLPPITGSEWIGPLKVIFYSWRNFAFMWILVAGFALLWENDSIRRWLQKLVPYGKMSLTNYLTQSFVGGFIYFGFGLGLYKYCGATMSLLIGIGLFLLQLGFSRWWFTRYKHGPLEGVWRRMTWIGTKNR